MVERYQYLVTQVAMDISLGQHFEVYIATLSALQVLFTKNKSVVYESIAPEYI